MITYYLLFLVAFISNIICRDFYAGMFKKNDFLVAQDRLYKERVPYRYMYAKYGRYFRCPITYFRVVDRLGVGRGPKVEVIRGGIRYKYMVLRLMSGYNLPISVNVYVGCENKMAMTKKTTTAQIHDHVTMKPDAGNSTAGNGSVGNGSAGNLTATDISNANDAEVSSDAPVVASTAIIPADVKT